MIKKIFLAGIFPLLFSSVVLSQIGAVSDLEFKRFQLDFRLAKSLDIKEKPVYEGSPYLFGEFMDADIILKAGKGYQDIPMNYNIYNDDFEFMMDNVSYSLGNNSIVSYIRIDGRDFFYSTYNYNSAEISGYLELMADGTYRFFKKHRVVYTEPQPTSGYVEAQPASFSTRSPDYFVELQDGSIKYYGKLKELAGLIPGEASEINDYISEKKLKIRREEDILELAGYLNNKME